MYIYYIGVQKSVTNFYLGNTALLRKIDKNYRVQKDLFTDLINLTWCRQDQVKIFFNRISYFCFQNLISDVESFPKRYKKIFFH